MESANLKKKTSWLLAALGLAAVSAQAQEKPAVEFSGSGFLTLGVGKMLGGSKGTVGDYECPCFTSDYAQAGVYDGRGGLQWKPDSKLGVQGVAALDGGRLSMTGQVVARGARDGKANLEWLYGSYKIDNTVTLQVGRKRLPMFYYSDIQDIGVALPWAHLPPQLYGWEAVNYNGANLLIQSQLGDWSLTANLLAGSETFKDSGYWKIYNGRQSRTDVRWKHIMGGDLILSKDWFETRLVFLQSDTQTYLRDKGVWDTATGSYDALYLDTDWWPQPTYKQRIHGIAFNVDRDNWLVRSELIRIDRPGQIFRDYASVLGVGYRMGKWQPMITHSRYWGRAVAGRDAFTNTFQNADASELEGHYTIALTLRYDLTTSSAIKVQLDRQVDQSAPNWGIGLDSAQVPSASGKPASGRPYGNARLLTISYDMVF